MGKWKHGQAEGYEPVESRSRLKQLGDRVARLEHGQAKLEGLLRRRDAKRSPGRTVIRLRSMQGHDIAEAFERRFE